MAVGEKTEKQQQHQLAHFPVKLRERKEKEETAIKIAISNIWQGAQMFQRKESRHVVK